MNNWDITKSLPDVAGQDAIWTSQAEFVDPKFPRKSTETKSSTSLLGGNKTRANVPIDPQPV